MTASDIVGLGLCVVVTLLLLGGACLCCRCRRVQEVSVLDLLGRCNSNWLGGFPPACLLVVQVYKIPGQVPTLLCQSCEPQSNRIAPPAYALAEFPPDCVYTLEGGRVIHSVQGDER